jgi:hypothetical protein
MHMVMAFAGLGTLEDSRIVHKQLIQVVLNLMSL